MQRPIFSQFRAQLPASLANCLSDLPSAAAAVNLAMDRLLIDPMQPDEGFWGTYGNMVFNVTPQNPYIVTPRGVARIILMDVCQKPVRVQNQFYEFLDFGRGYQPSGCATSVSSCPGACSQNPLQTYERNTVTTLGAFLPTPQKVRIFPLDSRDVGRIVIVQGNDQNGRTVLSTDATTGKSILGEIVTLTVPFVDTVNVWTGPLSAIQKDITQGGLQYFQVDPTTGIANSLSFMEPGEVSANYRQYLVNGLPSNCCNVPGGNIQVQAMVKFEFYPVAADSDFLVIPCIPALICECECIRYEGLDNLKGQQLATGKHAKALSLLMGQLDHYLGKERPAITVPIFGSDRLLLQPT